MKDTECAVVHLLALDTKWFSPASRSREAQLPRVGRLRAEFILESIADLAESLTRESAGDANLLVWHGPTHEAFELLCAQYEILAVRAPPHAMPTC